MTKPQTSRTFRTCRCDNPDCDVVFTTTHPFKRFHSRKCRIREAVSRREVMYRKTFGMSESSYRRRKLLRQGLKQPFKPHRSAKVEDKVRGRCFALPESLIRRMKNYPTVNWSASVRQHLERVVGEMELT